MITDVALAEDVEAALRANLELDVSLHAFLRGRLRPDSPVAGAFAVRCAIGRQQLFSAVPTNVKVQLVPRLPYMLPFLECAGVLERGADFIL